MPDLLSHHLELVQNSRISPEVAHRRGYESVMRMRRLAELGFAPSQQLVPGLLMPIRNIAGEVVTYSYRPDEPRADRRRTSKVIKYENPAGSKLPLDIPLGLQEELENPKVDLWITEGTRKVDALVSHGACAIGVIGVWGWRGEAVTWEGIALQGRTVYFCFDSDITTKPEVKRALDDFTTFLSLQGAQCLIVQLPHLPSGAKCGVDDYFQLGHTLEDVRQRAPEFLSTDRQLRNTVVDLLDKKLKRSDRQQLAQMIVEDLSQQGSLFSDLDYDSIFYYFDRDLHRLITLDWSEGSGAFRVGAFAKKLFNEYTLTANDTAILNDVQALFTNVAEDVRPKRLFWNSGTTLYTQISDTEAIRVSKDKIDRVWNGTDNVLFREGIVEELDLDVSEVPQHPQRLWRTVVDQLSLGKQVNGLTVEETQTFLEVYLHLAPWFWNWQGLELPILICVGESGSGKSYFWYVVQGVHLGPSVGQLAVKGTPDNLPELRAFFLEASGFLIFDNFRGGTVKDWRDKFEEELSRAVTHKSISHRVYFTHRVLTAEIPVIPGLSTTYMPLVSSDLVTRLVRIDFQELVTSKEQVYLETTIARKDSLGAWDQIILREHPGRKALYSDLLSAARRFFILADRPGKTGGGRQRLRLSGLDQALLLMAEAIGGEGLREEMDRILTKLPRAIAATQLSADPAIVLVRKFAEWRVKLLREKPELRKDFQLKEITRFVEADGGFRGKPKYPFDSESNLAGWIRERPDVVYRETGVRFNRDYSATSLYIVDEEQLDRIRELQLLDGEVPQI